MFLASPVFSHVTVMNVDWPAAGRNAVKVAEKMQQVQITHTALLHTKRWELDRENERECLDCFLFSKGSFYYIYCERL